MLVVVFESFIGSLWLVRRFSVESLGSLVVSLELCFFLQTSAIDVSKIVTENPGASIKEGAAASSH